MLDAALTALGSFATITTIVYLMLGVVAGLVVGLIPGLGGTAAVALLIPYVFVLDLPPEHGLPLLIGAVASVHHSDAIASILLGIPGSAASAVLMIDGHEMTKRGKASQALTLAFLSSMAGGLLGALGLTLSIPIARPLILSFSSPEIFMLCVLGVSLAALISKGNMLKGLLAACLGLLVGFIGSAPAEPVYRYTFGQLFLIDGVDLSVIALGIFGLAEIAALVTRDAPIAQTHRLTGSRRAGVRDFFHHWYHVLRGALVGIWAGVLPGVGATAGSFLAYGQARATARDKSKFGKGDPRGVIAPESAANSVESGDMIPTLLFGIPGGTPSALLLGCLLFYGIQPGPAMVEEHLDSVYVIVWSFAIASVIASLLCFPLAGALSRLTTVPLVRLAPALLVVIFLGAFQTALDPHHLVLVLIFGVLGFVMKELDFPRAPMLIGLVLSIPLERYYFLTRNLYSTSEWIQRPLVLVMLAVLAYPIIAGLVRWLRKRRKNGQRGRGGDDLPEATAVAMKEAPDAGNMFRGPGWALGFAIFAFVVVTGAFIMSFGFTPAAALAPRLVSAIGIVCAVPILIAAIREYLRAAHHRLDPAQPAPGAPAPRVIPAQMSAPVAAPVTAPQAPAAPRAQPPAEASASDAPGAAPQPTGDAPSTAEQATPDSNPYLLQTLQVFIWMAVFVALVWMFGLFVAVLVMIPVFGRHFAHLRWRTVALYTAGVFVALNLAGWSGDIVIPEGVLGGIPQLIQK